MPEVLNNMIKRRRILKRKLRIRSKLIGTKKRPRLSVFRSNKHFYGQLINDQEGGTILTMADNILGKKVSKDKKKTEVAYMLGEELSKLAKKKKILSVVFDKSSYKYHGRVKAFAEGARKGGLKF